MRLPSIASSLTNPAGRSEAAATAPNSPGVPAPVPVSLPLLRRQTAIGTGRAGLGRISGRPGSGSLAGPVAQDTPAGIAGADPHALPDLPERYTQPVLRRQVGLVNLAQVLEDAMHVAARNPDVPQGAAPELAERPPLRRDEGVVRGNALLQVSEGQSEHRAPSH